jgi:hypothetical protein
VKITAKRNEYLSRLIIFDAMMTENTKRITRSIEKAQAFAKRLSDARKAAE